jgi:hypothetical protein
MSTLIGGPHCRMFAAGRDADFGMTLWASMHANGAGQHPTGHNHYFMGIYVRPRPTNRFYTLHRRRRRVTLRKESRGEGEAGISLLGLTPGTPFMARVADSLAFYACQRLQQGSYQGVAFEVSGSTVPVSQINAMCQQTDRHAASEAGCPQQGCCRAWRHC